MIKFNSEDLKDLTEQQVLLIINFSLLANYANHENEALYNCYIENTDLLQIAQDKLKLSRADMDFLYHFFLENDYY